MTNDVKGLLPKNTVLTLSRIQQQEHVSRFSDPPREQRSIPAIAEHTCSDAPPAYRLSSGPPSHVATPAGMFVRIKL